MDKATIKLSCCKVSHQKLFSLGDIDYYIRLTQCAVFQNTVTSVHSVLRMALTIDSITRIFAYTVYILYLIASISYYLCAGYTSQIGFASKGK